MFYRHLFVGLALAALAVAAPSRLLATQDIVVKEISQLDDAWLAAEAKKDGAAVGQLLSADYLFTDNAGALFTKAQIIEHVNTNKDTVISSGRQHGSGKQ